jgi:hypothetical protein
VLDCLLRNNISVSIHDRVGGKRAAKSRRISARSIC